MGRWRDAIKRIRKVGDLGDQLYVRPPRDSRARKLISKAIICVLVHQSVSTTMGQADALRARGDCLHADDGGCR